MLRNNIEANYLNYWHSNASKLNSLIEKQFSDKHLDFLQQHFQLIKNINPTELSTAQATEYYKYCRSLKRYIDFLLCYSNFLFKSGLQQTHLHIIQNELSTIQLECNKITALARKATQENASQEETLSLVDASKNHQMILNHFKKRCTVIYNYNIISEPFNLLTKALSLQERTELINQIKTKSNTEFSKSTPAQSKNSNTSEAKFIIERLLDINALAKSILNNSFLYVSLQGQSKNFTPKPLIQYINEIGLHPKKEPKDNVSSKYIMQRIDSLSHIINPDETPTSEASSPTFSPRHLRKRSVSQPVLPPLASPKNKKRSSLKFPAIISPRSHKKKEEIKSAPTSPRISGGS